MAKYEFTRESERTFIVANSYCEDLPKIWAEVSRLEMGNCQIVVRCGEDEDVLAMTYVYRGISFSERIAKHMLKGALSGLGRHRRPTANRAARKASTEESKEVA